MLDADYAWCAGLFEGEGCITRNHKSVTLVLHTTDEDIAQRFRRIMGGHLNGPYPGTNKPFWSWSISKREEVDRIIGAMMPYLGERRTARAIELGL